MPFYFALVKLNADGNPRAWIYGVVDRLAANWRRKATRRSRLMEEWGPSKRAAERQTNHEEPDTVHFHEGGEQ